MMDAFEFCRGLARMCKTYEYCDGCPLEKWGKEGPFSCGDMQISDKYIQKKIDIVEKWSKEHPVKTMAMDFFEKFPNAMRGNEMKCPMVCLRVLGYTNETECPDDMTYCDCWNRPLEEE